ncbi:hypothetical protein QJQ45_002477 [Haematococcus lacustris]|nr:hypothetical protein QJQ45_002477 [Haematococcus lacustris]
MLLGGRVQLAKANHRRHFWSVHMGSLYPELAAVAIRVLSAHVTTAAAERNWSVFGQIFSKTRNRLTLESAKKIAYIRGNSNVGMKGVDEEVVLSQACLEVEEEEEEVVML